jgi:hypothetical protein
VPALAASHFYLLSKLLCHPVLHGFYPIASLVFYDHTGFNTASVYTIAVGDAKTSVEQGIQ